MTARSNLSHLPTAVPSDVRPKYEAITALTDPFCMQHLNDEYAEMCHRRVHRCRAFHGRRAI